MILLYAWGFPCLWFVHGDACPYARLPECNGFASEHHDADRSGDPLIHNLHVWRDDGRCAVCALARSATLAHKPAVGATATIRLLNGAVPLSAAGPLRIATWTPGSRAPPSS